MKTSIIKILLPVIFLIVGALIDQFIPRIISMNKVALEYAPFHGKLLTDVPGLLNGRVKILVGEQSQENLSISNIYLFNRSNEAFKDITLTFKFFNEKGNIPELLDSELKKPETFPDSSVIKLDSEDKSTVSYKISSFPISDDYNSDFVASFVFLGKKSPNIILQSDYTNKKAIEIYEYDKKTREIKSYLIASLVLAPFIIIFFIFLFWQEKKDRIRFNKKLELSALNLEGTRLSKEEVKNIVMKSFELAKKMTNKELKDRLNKKN